MTPIRLGSGAVTGADPGGGHIGRDAGAWDRGRMKEATRVAHRGGPWRATEQSPAVAMVGRQPGGRAREEAIMSDRGLRHVVYAYVVAVVAGVAITLVGLHEGWW